MIRTIESQDFQFLQKGYKYLELRGKAGGCARVTAGPKKPHLGVCPAFTFHFHALEKEMATHSSVLAWRIPGMGERGGLLSMGSHRVGHD